jgi:hypothetical protein
MKPTARMLAKLRPRSVYDVLAAIGCFVALGGTSAYAINEWTGANIVDESLTGADVQGKAAAGSTPAVNGSLTTHDIAGQQANSSSGTPFIDGTLTQWDIKNGSIATTDLAGNAVTGAKVAGSTLNGSDVSDGSLTGADIDESTLGKVPDADKVDGRDASELEGARAYGRMVASQCQPTPGLCTVFRGKRVAYIVRVATGTYCVGVDAISAAAPQSLAMVTPFGRKAWASQIANASCVSTEFEILAGLDDDPSPSNAVSFDIVIP